MSGNDNTGDIRDAQIEAANKAARVKERQQEKSIAFAKEQAVIARADLAAGREVAGELLDPSIQVGNLALTSLQDLLGLGTQEGADRELGLLDTAESRFAQEQAQKAEERGAAATGLLLSGNQREELSRVTTQQAKTTFQDRVNRLNALSEQGRQSSTNLASLNVGSQANAANVAQNLGTNVVNIQSDTADDLANLELQKGQAVASAFANKPKSFLAQTGDFAKQLVLAGAGQAASTAGSNLGNKLFV